MRRALKLLVPFVVVAGGCQPGEPTGDIAPPDVKIMKPGDPGPQPTGAVGAPPAPDPGGGQAASQ